MFTGIVEAVGKVVAIDPRGADSRMHVEAGRLDLSQVKSGDSIAINGVCLTVVERTESNFAVDVSTETLACTTLGGVKLGSLVNLEKALTLASPLGGHLVTGHVDGVGIIVKRFNEGRSMRFIVQAPEALARYISPKGSICIDGISLTVNSVHGAEFGVLVIPHTLEKTNAANYQPGTQVNIEVDIIARYIEKILLASKDV